MSGSPKATTNTPSSPTARTSCAAAPATTPQLVRGIIAARDDRARTADQVAASTDREDLPDRVRSLSAAAPTPVQSRRTAYRHGHKETQELVAERQRWIDQHIGRDRSQDQGLDYGIDL